MQGNNSQPCSHQRATDDRNAAFLSFQRHLESKQAGLFQKLHPWELHPRGQSSGRTVSPAAGVPEEERVLGRWGSRNLELCLNKGAWAGASEEQETPTPSVSLGEEGRVAGKHPHLPTHG